MLSRAFSALVSFAFVAFTSATNITFDIALIPAIQVSLPAFTLGSVVKLPPAFLNETLQSVSPGSNFTNFQNSNGLIAHSGERVIGVVDPDTGEVTFYPNYEALEPIIGPTGENNGTYLNNSAIFPQDDTIVNALPGLTLYSALHVKNGSGPEPVPWIYHIATQRLVTVENTAFPVLGPGSTAILGFGAKGNLVSFNYLWHPAKQSTKVSPLSVEGIYASITAQLQSAAALGPLNVTSVDISYYDSGSKFIQPVYAFTATRPKSGNVTEDVTISGYVPVGKTALEPLPDLTTPPKSIPPTVPSPSQNSPRKRSFISRIFSNLYKRGPTVTVGRYVIRDSEAEWVTSANNFWSNLGSSTVNFINAQYYWAYPWLYTTYKEQFVDSVNVALTEAHGNWHRFRTSPTGDRVYINDDPALDIPATGYGPGAGGHLAYWVIHSCEVIPSETDYPGQPYRSFDYWWSIFNGLHAVMGYRTEMYINDGVTTPFAKAISRGVAVVPAWMSAVLNDKAWYSSSSKYTQTYLDGNRGIKEPFGRASTIAVCGHTNDVVWNLENLGRPERLCEWWYNN
jgi:hypothetical protein